MSATGATAIAPLSEAGEYPERRRPTGKPAGSEPSVELELT